MSWRDRPMLAVDTETSGPDPETANVVTICAGTASTAGWEPVQWLLQQPEPIPAEATEIHGISTEQANRDGRPGRDCLAEARNVITTAWSLGQPVVAFNAVFDLTVLDRSLRRHGLDGFETLGPVIDPLVIDKALDRFRKGSRRLVDVAAHYGITLDGAHDATADALAAVRLAWVLAGRLPAELRDDLDALTQWQADQYREQRLSFAAYRRKRGEPLDDETTDWPIRALTAQPSAA